MSKIITLTDYYYLKEQIDDLLEQKASISHSHGNITNEGVITNQINKNVVTDGNGKITTEAKPTIPVANATATNIKMDGTQSAGLLSSFARADHVHPVDTSRATASHTHGNITNDGVITNQANKNVVTDSNGKITTEAKTTIPTGSTSQAGIVQLSSAINSTSTTEAATPSAVKTAYDTLNGYIGNNTSRISTVENKIEEIEQLLDGLEEDMNS